MAPSKQKNNISMETQKYTAVINIVTTALKTEALDLPQSLKVIHLDYPNRAMNTPSNPL